jgi:hypothetical protein
MNEEQKDYDILTKEAKNCQENHYKQSSKFSEISRNITYGMLATLWIVMFSNGKVILPSIPIIITLCLCFIYLLFDLIHYYSDSFRYRKEANKLLKIYDNNIKLNVSKEEILKIITEHNAKLDEISKTSSTMLDIKFIIMIITSISFISSIVLYSTCHF